MSDPSGPAPFFAGFANRRVKVADVEINTVIGGDGPPLLLLHGHPQTHVAWWKVAPALARRWTVVATDLRGYGNSSKPHGRRGDDTYSKRTMGNDQVEVMQQLGFDRFHAIGHDRGGRVLHRMMADHPQTVEHGMVLDIAPTDAMYAATDQRFATEYFWWFFHIQAEPLPERMIESQTLLYLKSHLDQQSKTAGAVSAEAFAQYLRCYDPPGIHAVCEDYRASVGVDADHAREDRAAGRSITAPLTAVWGSQGSVGKLFDVLGLWRTLAVHVDGEPLDCGHLIPEERPGDLLRVISHYFDDSSRPRPGTERTDSGG